MATHSSVLAGRIPGTGEPGGLPSKRSHRVGHNWSDLAAATAAAAAGKNTRVGCHSLLQRIFLTQGSNLGLPHCRQILYSLSHQGSPCLCVCVCVCVCIHWKHSRLFVKWAPSPGIDPVASTKGKELLANCPVKLLGCQSRWLLQGQQNT